VAVVVVWLDATHSRLLDGQLICDRSHAEHSRTERQLLAACSGAAAAAAAAAAVEQQQQQASRRRRRQQTAYYTHRRYRRRRPSSNYTAGPGRRGRARSAPVLASTRLDR